MSLPTVRQISAGAIVYNNSDGIRILLLEQNNAHYNRKGRDARRKIIDIGPCGRVEKDESLLRAAKRELKQETNLDLHIDTSFKGKVSYTFDAVALEGRFKGRKVHIRKTRIYFIADASRNDLKKLKLSEEHIAYMLVTIDEAIKIKYLHNSQRDLLKMLRTRLSAIK